MAFVLVCLWFVLKPLNPLYFTVYSLTIKTIQIVCLRAFFFLQQPLVEGSVRYFT